MSLAEADKVKFTCAATQKSEKTMVRTYSTELYLL